MAGNPADRLMGHGAIHPDANKTAKTTPIAVIRTAAATRPDSTPRASSRIMTVLTLPWPSRSAPGSGSPTSATGIHC